MAYREVQMWEILNVLRRIGRGESKAAVALATGHTRRTVRRYVQVAEALGWVPGEHEADEALALEVYRAVRPGVSSDEPGSAEAELLPRREAITKWLEGDGASDPALRLTKIHRKLEREGVSVSYPSLRRFVIKHCGFTGRARKLTGRCSALGTASRSPRTRGTTGRWSRSAARPGCGGSVGTGCDTRTHRT